MHSDVDVVPPVHVPEPAICHRLQEGGPLTTPRSLDHPLRCLGHSSDVIPVHNLPRDPVGDCEAGGRVVRLTQRDVHVAGELVVLHNKENRGIEHTGEVERLVDDSLLKRAVPKVADPYVSGPLHLGGKRRSDRKWNGPCHDRR